MANIEPRRKLPLIGIITLMASLAVIGIIWFGSVSIISSKLVDDSLKQVSAQISEIGNDYGMDAKLSYDKVDIKGWGFNKHAVIYNIGIDVEDKSGMYPVKWRLATDEAVLSKDSGDSSNVLLTLPKPLNLLQDGAAAKSFVFSEPLKYSYGKSSVDGNPAFEHNVTVPLRVTLMEASGAPEDSAANGDIQAGQEEALTFVFNKNPSFKIVSSENRKVSSAFYDLSEMTVSKNDQTYITIGRWVSNFNEKPVDTLGHVSGAYKLEMQDLVLHGKGNGKPYNVNVDTLFTADSTDVKAAQQQADEAKDGTKTDAPFDAAAMSGEDGLSENRDVVVKQFVLSNPDFKISASGNFSNIKGDPLPSGEINVDIENVQQFLVSDLVPVENRRLMESILVKVSGKPLSEQSQISIPLKREKMGMFFVGKSNFEELAAIWLSGMIMPSSPAPVAPFGEAAPVAPMENPGMGLSPAIDGNPPVGGISPINPDVNINHGNPGVNMPSGAVSGEPATGLPEGGAPAILDGATPNH